MLTCPACGAESPDDARSCSACGTRLHGNTASFEPVGAPEASAPETIHGEAEVPVLVVHKGPDAGERFYLDRPTLTVGRDPGSDIFLNDVTVSRSHAVIEITPSGVTVTDSGSLNGTYVGGTCVEKAVLRHGDILQIGRFQLLFLEGRGAGR